MIRTLAVAVALAVAAPALAVVSFGVEATVGAQRLGIDRLPGRSEPLASMGDLGATLLLRLGPVALGGAAEGAFLAGSLEQVNASVLAGLVGDLLPVLRLELLGEVGASGLRSSADVERATAGDLQRFYGVRPGLSVKLPAFPLRIGAWGLARWGMPGAGSGPSYGLLGRVGLEF